jgi:hypothetical protein
MLRSYVALLLAATCLCGCASGKGHGWAYTPPGGHTLKQVPVPDVEAAKDACARETGESKTPGRWLGFSSAFMACMKARGWTPGSAI